MKFELFLSLKNMHWYGCIPCPKDGSGSEVEVYQLQESDSPLLEANFLEPVDALCDALLDYGDIDFFDADKCKKLLSLHFKTMYIALKEYDGHQQSR